MLCFVVRLLLSIQVCLLLAPLCCFANSAEIGEGTQAELVWTMQDMVEEDDKADALRDLEGGAGQAATSCRPITTSILHAAANRCALVVCYRADVPSPPPLPA